VLLQEFSEECLELREEALLLVGSDITVSPGQRAYRRFGRYLGLRRRLRFRFWRRRFRLVLGHRWRGRWRRGFSASSSSGRRPATVSGRRLVRRYWRGCRGLERQCRSLAQSGLRSASLSHSPSAEYGAERDATAGRLPTLRLRLELERLAELTSLPEHCAELLFLQSCPFLVVSYQLFHLNHLP